MPSIFEDLPNEILLFIFNYLSSLNLIYSFYRLNYRFTSLIRMIDYLHIDFSTHPLSKTQLIHILNQLRSLNIHSIRLSSRYSIDFIPFLISYLPPSQLIHLRSLTLLDADRTMIEKLVHKYPHLTSLSIESPVWRSIPRHSLPHFPHLIHCHLPTLTFLPNSHSQIIHLRLDHCTTDDLLQLNTFVPNLHSLTLTLNQSTSIPHLVNFPSSLTSLKLILRSVLFNEFKRLIMMIKNLKNLTISFSNTEHEVHCFDRYLFGEHWSSIYTYTDNLQLNLIVHQTSEAFLIEDLISNFHWYKQRIHCQTIDDTNGYHLFSLPFIDEIYRINSMINYNDNLFNRNDFNRVNHLHLTIPNHTVEKLLQISSKCMYRNVKTLTIIASSISHDLLSFVNTLMMNSSLRILELRFTSLSSTCRDFFDKLIVQIPASIEMLILNIACTRFLFELLDNNAQLLANIKRLLCSVKNRDEFDSLILLLLEIFHEKSLIYLNISLENPNKSSNLLSGWLLQTNYLKKARIRCSDRQCAIWI